tara:strand:- start:4053 stop:5033 length:981 start_codon:yes stop_codon:yes gene_type:complete
MKSIIYICPSAKNKPTGGIKIIYRHVELLSNLLPKGTESKIFHFENTNFKCDWFPHKVNFKKNSTFDSSKEFAIIPEWMAVYHAKILQKANIKYGIFVQNGFYLNTRPENNFSEEEIKKAYEKAEIIISYSNEITECIKLTFPTVKDKIFKINISVDNKKFQYTEEISKNKENLITYMPRKNKIHSSKLIFILKQHLPRDWKIKILDNLSENDVINLFKRSKIFLSFAELEGFGLPPVEAALSGNSVIGYTGESGKEYWDPPIFDEVFSGDLRTFAKKVIDKVTDFKKNGYIYNNFKPYIDKLADKYSVEKEKSSLSSLIEQLKNF